MFLIKKWHVFWLLVTLFILVPLSAANATVFTDEATNVPVDKTWTIKFNFPVVESSVKSNAIYVLNSKKEKLAAQVSVNDRVVTVHPPKAGYELGQNYTLHITTDILGQAGKEVKALKQPITKPFTIATEVYTIVDIRENGTYSVASSHPTFDKANAYLQDDQGIMLNEQYVKIPSGFVATNTQTVTSIYKEPTFTSKYEYTGVATDTELIYVDATADYVKVHIGGQDMYVKQEDVTLIPTATAKGQSYYKANQQGLWHYVYHHHSGKYDGAYVVGKKPEFLNVGVNYYSVDGANFTNKNGEIAGKSYAYFQYLSPRVPTNYSAAELDTYINSQLFAKEQTGGRYTNATAKSPLKKLGGTLKSIEKEHRINALFILSLAIHESDYGMSCHAQNYNNLFGLTVPDNDAHCSENVVTSSEKYYSTIMENISALVNQLNTYYLDPLNMKAYRYNGVALGNKMIGMNVRYASDPYWGEKIAGHMYNIDQELGSTDYKKHDIGFTTSREVSIRKEPIVNHNRAYQYKLDWTIKRLDKMPITLSATPSQTNGWLRVISELPKDGTDLYTVTPNVHTVTTY
ncbi:hypothetical protein CSV72_12220 [Sporosarcina sp. P20a]|uniref:glucosaminidase domain-containing protein n=1 Tax=Sporosarcina sp. P20a TaxID=2048256 RepID=UPI000C163032|nr:glucosaminidase domain-containing protein [Sporosarcina sp. P20a]PIC85723.1 hypothetical protein CSV72_12220 [Sporosarcina sp. P20a]